MRLLCPLGWVAAMLISAARAVELEDYDFNRFSQEVTEDALSLGVHDLLGKDSRLIVAGTGKLQGVNAKRFNLIEGEYRHRRLFASALTVSKTHATCRTTARTFG